MTGTDGSGGTSHVCHTFLIRVPVSRSEKTLRSAAPVSVDRSTLGDVCRVIRLICRVGDGVTVDSPEPGSVLQ